MFIESGPKTISYFYYYFFCVCLTILLLRLSVLLGMPILFNYFRYVPIIKDIKVANNNIAEGWM